MNSFLKSIVICFAVGIVCVSCSSVKVYAPYAIVEAPTITNKRALKWNILDYNQVAVYEVSSDASNRPPTLTTASEKNTSSNGSLSSIFSYGLNNDFDLGVIIWSKELGVRGKWIFLNLPGEKNGSSHLMSIFSRLSSNYSSNQGDQKGIFGPGGYKWEAQTRTDSMDIGTSYGYKIDSFLIYTGLAYNDLKSKASIHHFASDDNTSPAADYAFNVGGYSKTLSLGIESGSPGQFYLSVNRTQINYGDYNKFDDHLKIGFSTSQDIDEIINNIF